jgi:hypothetical protein
MQPILKSCCGIDVHKEKIKACIAKGPLDKPPKFEIKTFLTMTSGLLKLKDWLRQNRVEAVAMESTGVYWKPIFNILEDEFPIVSSESSVAPPLKHISRKSQGRRVMSAIANGLRRFFVVA